MDSKKRPPPLVVEDSSGDVVSLPTPSNILPTHITHTPINEKKCLNEDLEEVNLLDTLDDTHTVEQPVSKKRRVVEKSPGGGRFVRYNTLLQEEGGRVVYAALDAEHGIDVAWHEILTRDLFDDQKKEKTVEEMMFEDPKNFKHKYLLKYFATWEDERNNKLVFITETTSSGTMATFCRTTSLDESNIRPFCRNLLNALEFLHAKDPPIVHRNLNLSSIYVNGTEKGGLRLGGFETHIGGGGTNIKRKKYTAPEQYDNKGQDVKSDIYALGMCLLEMATREVPYAECPDLAALIYKVRDLKEKPNVFLKMDESKLKHFIARCLAYHPEDRPSALELTKDVFLEETEEEKKKKEKKQEEEAEHSKAKDDLTKKERVVEFTHEAYQEKKKAWWPCSMVKLVCECDKEPGVHVAVRLKNDRVYHLEQAKVRVRNKDAIFLEDSGRSNSEAALEPYVGSGSSSSSSKPAPSKPPLSKPPISKSRSILDLDEEKQEGEVASKYAHEYYNSESWEACQVVAQHEDTCDIVTKLAKKEIDAVPVNKIRVVGESLWTLSAAPSMTSNVVIFTLIKHKPVYYKLKFDFDLDLDQCIAVAGELVREIGVAPEEKDLIAVQLHSHITQFKKSHVDRLVEGRNSNLNLLEESVTSASSPVPISPSSSAESATSFHEEDVKKVPTKRTIAKASLDREAQVSAFMERATHEAMEEDHSMLFPPPDLKALQRDHDVYIESLKRGETTVPEVAEIELELSAANLQLEELNRAHEKRLVDLASQLKELEEKADRELGSTVRDMKEEQKRKSLFLAIAESAADVGNRLKDVLKRSCSTGKETKRSGTREARRSSSTGSSGKELSTGIKRRHSEMPRRKKSSDLMPSVEEVKKNKSKSRASSMDTTPTSVLDDGGVRSSKKMVVTKSQKTTGTSSIKGKKVGITKKKSSEIGFTKKKSSETGLSLSKKKGGSGVSTMKKGSSGGSSTKKKDPTKPRKKSGSSESTSISKKRINEGSDTAPLRSRSASIDNTTKKPSSTKRKKTEVDSKSSKKKKESNQKDGSVVVKDATKSTSSIKKKESKSTNPFEQPSFARKTSEEKDAEKERLREERKVRIQEEKLQKKLLEEAESKELEAAIHAEIYAEHPLPSTQVAFNELNLLSAQYANDPNLTLLQKQRLAAQMSSSHGFQATSSLKQGES